MFPPPLRLNGFDVVMAWHPRREAEAGVTWLRQQLKLTAREGLYENNHHPVPAET
jgi:hypothetical protein